MCHIRKIVPLVLALSLLLLLPGCSRAEKHPGIEYAEAHLQQDKEDLQTLVQWLQESEYPYIVFDGKDDTMFIEFEDIPIPEEIQPTLDRLFKNNKYNTIIKDEEDNTIQFLYWTSFQEKDCGLLYALDKTERPSAQYMTQCEPLSVDGWYYYFSDYNKWRIGETTAY